MIFSRKVNLRVRLHCAEYGKIGKYEVFLHKKVRLPFLPPERCTLLDREVSILYDYSLSDTKNISISAFKNFFSKKLYERFITDLLNDGFKIDEIPVP